MALLKLGRLALKTTRMSKPIAYQSNDRITTTMQVQLRSYGHATDVETQPLKGGDKAAVSMGKVLFRCVALGGLIFLVQTSARSSGRREVFEAMREEMMEERNQMTGREWQIVNDLKLQKRAIKLMEKEMELMKQKLKEYEKALELLEQQICRD